MNNPIQAFAMNLIARNPNVANGSPFAQAGIQAIQNGDNKAGEQLAMNICQSMGMSPQQVIQQAMGRFGIK